MKRKTTLYIISVATTIRLLNTQPLFAQEGSFTPPPRVAEILLLQDESESMETTDPYNVRVSTAPILRDYLLLGGEGNTLGFLMFGTSTASVIPPGTNFERVVNAARQLPALEERTMDYLSLETTPFRMYTDFFRALTEAVRILKNTSETVEGTTVRKEKMVILLTDGRIDPWPGDPRFGLASERYIQRIKNLPLEGRARYQAGREFLGEITRIDRERIANEIIPEFRENGWKIYTIGFSDGVDRNFLMDLATGTFGEGAIARDYTELKDIIERIVPRAEKIITLPISDFCDRLSVARTVRIPDGITRVLFKVDFGEMITQRLPLVTRNDISTIKIGSPQGATYDKNHPCMMWTSNRRSEVFAISCKIDNPPPGNWRVEITSTRRICGRIKPLAEREQRVNIVLTPRAETYPLDSEVDIIASLEGNGRLIPITGGRIEIFTPLSGRREIPSTLEENTMRGRIRFQESGEHLIRTKLTDREFNSEVKGEIRVRVGGRCRVFFQDVEEIDLGTLGGTEEEVTSPQIEVGTDCSSIPVKVIPPRLEKGGSVIPTNWIVITPEEGGVAMNNPFRFQISIRMPMQIPPELEGGVYEGFLTVTSPVAETRIQLPIKVEFSPPILSFSPDSLYFNFRWRIGKSMVKELSILSNSPKTFRVYVTLPPALRRTSDEISDRRIIFTADAEGERQRGIIETSVVPGEETTIKFKVDLDDVYVKKHKNINESTRIKPGTYKGTILVRGEIGKTFNIPVRVHIPKSPLILIIRKASKWASIVLGIIFGIFVITAIIMRKRGEELTNAKINAWRIFFLFLLAGITYLLTRSRI